MGLNKFADLTAEEFKALYASGYRAQEKRSKNVELSLLHAKANPASVDWSVKGAWRPAAECARVRVRARAASPSFPPGARSPFPALACARPLPSRPPSSPSSPPSSSLQAP